VKLTGRSGPPKLHPIESHNRTHKQDQKKRIGGVDRAVPRCARGRRTVAETARGPVARPACSPPEAKAPSEGRDALIERSTPTPSGQPQVHGETRSPRSLGEKWRDRPVLSVPVVREGEKKIPHRVRGGGGRRGGKSWGRGNKTSQKEKKRRERPSQKKNKTVKKKTSHKGLTGIKTG